MPSKNVLSAVRLTDKTTKDIIYSKKELQTAPLLGSGSFSKVFAANNDSVFKVTVDQYHLCYLHNKLYASPHRPKVLSSVEHLGTLAHGHDLFCQQLERLSPLEVSSPEYALVSKICRTVNKSIYTTQAGCGPTVTRQILKELGAMGMSSSLMEFLARVLTFDAQFPRAEFDFTPRNFMVRPETGELVVSDPVFDLDAIIKIRGVVQTRKQLGYKTASRWA